jgi:hypothetical protein
MTRRSRASLTHVSLYILIVAACCGQPIAYAADDRQVLFTAANPEPACLPTLGMWEQHSHRKRQTDRFVSATFPNVPNFTCDLWCFESDGISFVSGKPLENGGIEMQHSWKGKDWHIVSTATPLPGCLDFVARLLSNAVGGNNKTLEYPSLNLCWQLRRAPDFASQPDPYPAFVKRCFIFTDKGRTFLDETRRLAIPARPSTAKENNPPWVQIYLPESAPADIRAEPNAWADYSPDRYRLPIIGAVSRDGKYLAAMATGAEGVMCQAWHDCMHNNGRWLPADDTANKTWHVRIYVMENAPDALLTRFTHDFPTVRPWE